ncbi:Carbonic anhydrase 4 [Orchesella cincta]|uniref:carbonic anhydrase n=1 Tax=Orchesella cincta TaxID=48709 RepID=A0A1D2MHV3_ORCCI|nr:Carbonic anhydrase 4 [Orchesella cincta]
MVLVTKTLMMQPDSEEQIPTPPNSSAPSATATTIWTQTNVNPDGRLQVSKVLRSGINSTSVNSTPQPSPTPISEILKQLRTLRKPTPVLESWQNIFRTLRRHWTTVGRRIAATLPTPLPHPTADRTGLTPDAQIIQNLIDALKKYLNGTREQLFYFDWSKYRFLENPEYKTVEDIPFHKVYEEFLSHYVYADTTRYVIDLKKDIDRDLGLDSLYYSYDIIRRVYRGYVEAVISQLNCTKAIVQQVTTRRDGRADIKRVLDNARKKCIDPINATLNATTRLTTYVVTRQILRYLYDTYFLRKESRQRYTLPLTPVQFPICKHNEPSPINIHTNQGRKSTLTSYKFGDAAYRLNRFFISFPQDGSTLLSVGIVDGERLDESSVKLTGVAVKGQHLTFPNHAHSHCKDWKSQGSEHRLDSKGGQMELQMIFTIAGSADPIKYWHVLARVQNRLFQFREKLVIILSVLVDALETEEDVIRKIEEEGTQQDPYLFEPFTQAAYHFRKEREDHSEQDEPRGYVSMDPVFRFIDFIPKTKSKFYTYRGSLSWPPCFGYVIWSVYEQRLYISKRQFDEFIKIPAFGMANHNRASDNFRREDQITVEEEKRVNIDYATLQNLINKRTVDRFILEGIHDHTPEGDDALVDEAVYYLDSEGISQKKGGGTCAATTTLALLSTIYGAARDRYYNECSYSFTYFTI